MSSTKVLLIGLVLCALLFFGFIVKDTLVNHQAHDLTDSKLPRKETLSIPRLGRIIAVQNATIFELEQRIIELTRQLGEKSAQLPKKSEVSTNTVTNIDNNPIKHLDLSKSEQECSKRYGLDLLVEWQSHAETWCDGSDSKLVCYPYHQKHKQLDGRPPDVFCVASNFVIDFSKVSGQASAHKPPLGSQYHGFHMGSLQASCAQTSQYKPRLFMPHQSLQFHTFQPNTPLAYDITEEKATYLLARDEDCENTFHSTADFMSMFMVSWMLNQDIRQQQVMLFDLHPDGPYMDLMHQAFSPSQKPFRFYDKYSGKKVLFRKLIWHLESPAGLIFPRVANPHPMSCLDSSLFHAYRRHVLKAFDLLDVPPPAQPTIVLILRRRTKQKNVGRVIGNEDQVISVVKSGTMVQSTVTDLSSMTYAQQLALLRKANIIVGAHGAGLMQLLFSAEETVLVEIHPSYRQDRHFRHLAKMLHKIYLPVRAHTRETCVGSSDTITVPIEEFRQVLDSAVRLARQFDTGLAECGLECDGGILALDKKYDSLYSSSFRKSKSVDTRFPCG